MQRYQKSYLDVLHEVKEILKRDSKRKRKLKYAIKSHQSILLVTKIKLRSHSEDQRFLLKNKLSDGYERLQALLQNICVNKTIEAHSSSEQKYVSFFFGKGDTKFIKSNVQTSLNESIIEKDNIVIRNNNTQTRTSSSCLRVSINDKFLHTVNKLSNNDPSSMEHTDCQRKITANFKNCMESENYINDVDNDSSRSSHSFRSSIPSNVSKFSLIDKDFTKCQRETKNVRSRTSKLSKIFVSSESSIHSSNKPNLPILPDEGRILSIDKASINSVEQYISAMSSGSDLSSCITPIIKYSTNNRLHQKSGRRISCSLSPSSRSIQDRSHSNESSRSLTSTIRHNRRSYSYSSRSSSSSQISTCLSESSNSRSPSIPRRYGSPSFLERRRITSARKRPIPYRRPSPSSSSNSSRSLSSRNSFTSSPYDDWSPESNKIIQR